MHMVVIRFISVKYLHGMILFVDIFIYNIERVKDTYYLNKYKKVLQGIRLIARYLAKYNPHLEQLVFTEPKTLHILV